MEKLNASVSVPCPIHTSEFIQRVDIDFNANQQLYCTECILQQEDPSFLSTNLKTIPDLIQTAATFYQENKEAKVESEVPPDLVNLMSSQAEKLEKLSKHIEEEKKKIEHIFGSITKDFLTTIEEKKNEYLNALDQQLFNLRYWYIFFDKQIKKTYPTENDLPFLFPTKEDLVKKLQKIINATQLTEFVRSLKEDLNEQKLGIKTDRRTYLNTLSKELITVENIKPVFEIGDFGVLSLQTEMKRCLEDCLDRMLTLQNPLKDVVKGKSHNSKLIKSEDFEILREWIQNDFKFNPKLIYRASRDGMNAQAFHKYCDNKGPTVTIMKIQFDGSSTTSIVGGFIDAHWTQAETFIHSSKAFLFSLTTKVKCPVSSEIHAGYGNMAYGPTFGAGLDLAVWAEDQCYINPSSYTNAAKLIDAKNYGGSGQAHFKVLNIEVYSLN